MLLWRATQLRRKLKLKVIVILRSITQRVQIEPILLEQWLTLVRCHNSSLHISALSKNIWTEFFWLARYLHKWCQAFKNERHHICLRFSHGSQLANFVCVSTFWQSHESKASKSSKGEAKALKPFYSVHVTKCSRWHVGLSVAYQSLFGPFTLWPNMEKKKWSSVFWNRMTKTGKSHSLNCK